MSDIKHQPPQFSEQEAAKFAQNLYGIRASARQLPSERDQNFKLIDEAGQAFVLKISNAAEDRAILEFQNQAMVRLGAQNNITLCPQVCPTASGEQITTVEDANKSTYFVRLLTYLSGVPFAQVNPHSPQLLHNLGAFLGSISRALDGFSHPATRRDLQWDLKHAGPVIKAHKSLLTNPAQRSIIEQFLTHFESEVEPILPALRKSVIHNDGNDYNVLVTGARFGRQEIAGIIDFGDMVYSYTVGELAVAAAYAMLDKADPVAAAAHVVRGYHSIFPLSERELAALYPLICMRLCLSVVLSAYQQHREPGNVYLAISEKPIWALLKQLTGVNPKLAHYTFRRACNLPPCPQTEAIVNRLKSNKAKFGSVVKPNLSIAPNIVFDLSVGSLELGRLAGQTDSKTFTDLLSGRMQAAGVEVGIGRYNEARQIYSADLFKTTGDDTGERRTVHLGIDVFMEAGSPIFAPLDGVIHSFRNNTAHLDYGPTIIIEHKVEHEIEAENLTFFTLYGHLSEEALTGLYQGKPVKGGDQIATIGDYPVNGDWPPHLHFQIITDLLGREGEFPGVAPAGQREVWLSICPDPNLILGIPEPCFPAEGLSHQEILKIRAKSLGKSLSLSYQKPLKIVRGSRQYLYDDTGRAYLDAVNNVPHVGHCHPRVVKAAQDQMAVLNTNTRYLHDNIVNYARRLVATLPDPLSVCFFVCTGSEANELALRLAKTHTAHTDILVVDGAYHGNTGGAIEVSPYKFDGPGGAGAPPHVHKVLMPDGYRGLYKSADPKAGKKYAQNVQETIEQVQLRGKEVYAFICESLLGCGGQIVLPDGYLTAAYRHVRAAGGVCIADEVQVGFGRVGSHFWGFELQGVIPDILTLGKPMGNGHPLAAVVTTPEIAASFDNGMEYFNTYGGNPVSCAAGLAVLEVIEDEDLQANALKVGQRMKANLTGLQEKYPLIGDVRGQGLFIGVELVLDRETLTPAPRHASYVVERMKDYGILISTDGPLHNVLKIKPPLVFSEANADFLVETLDRVMGEDVLRV